MSWLSIAKIGLGVLGGISSSRSAQSQQEASLEQVREQNRGALERQNDEQAFEEYLINRRSVAGGPAYGGSAGPMPDFWFGLQDQAEGAQISDFFGSMKTSSPIQSPAGAGQVDVQPFSEAGRGDARMPLSYDPVRRDLTDQDQIMPTPNAENLIGLFNRTNRGA